MHFGKFLLLVLPWFLVACEVNNRGEPSWTFRAKGERRKKQREIVRERPRREAEHEEWQALSAEQREKKIDAILEDCRMRLAALNSLAPFHDSGINVTVHQSYLREARKTRGLESVQTLEFQNQRITNEVYEELKAQTKRDIDWSTLSKMSGDELVAYVIEVTSSDSGG